ncbi:MAG TPA: hypothetical protein VEG44_04575 [Candidatus Acidoferrales bacterium]|nr:hypothetical protein [Candidatus Acidoferrales bacterium]
MRMTLQGGVFVDIGFNKQIPVDGINSNIIPRLPTMFSVWWYHPTSAFSVWWYNPAHA